MRGFRLPLRFQSIETVRHRNDHVPVFSHWRLPYDGVSGFPNDNSIKIFDQGWSPLERDFTDCQPQHLRFWAEGCEADCQMMEVSGMTGEGRHQSFRYEVGKEARLTNERFQKVSNVTFCEGVKGHVIIAQEDGRELARYDTGASAPQFREYKVIGGCNPRQLIIIANCAYVDLTDDCDIVEFGNPLVWQTLARYIRLLNKSDKDSNDRANMSSYLETAVSLMREQSAVDLSETIGSRIRRAPITGKRLSGEYYGATRRSRGGCCY